VTAKLFVPLGAFSHATGGDDLEPSHVYSAGSVPPSTKAGLVSVKRSPSCAAVVAEADSPPPPHPTTVAASSSGAAQRGVRPRCPNVERVDPPGLFDSIAHRVVL